MEATALTQDEKTSPVVELTLQNFDALVEESQDIWLIMILLPSCRMCKAMTPRFKRAAEMLKGQVKFGSINLREQYKFKNMFEIKTAPTVKLWNTNTEISEIEMKSMRNSVTGITTIAEKCMLSNGIEFESCVKK